MISAMAQFPKKQTCPCRIGDMFNTLQKTSICNYLQNTNRVYGIKVYVCITAQYSAIPYFRYQQHNIYGPSRTLITKICGALCVYLATSSNLMRHLICELRKPRLEFICISTGA